MNYDFLSMERLRPFWFRYVGLIIAFAAITISIYLKLDSGFWIPGLSSDHLKAIFLFSLLLVLNARSKPEDERMSQIRLQITRFGFNFIVGILALIILVNGTGGNPASKELMFNWVVSIVTGQALIFEAIKSDKIMDFFERHQTLFQLMAVLFIVFTLQIIQKFW